MDIRHPLKDSDQMLINWCQETQTPFLILLNKSDKLSKKSITQYIGKDKETGKRTFRLL